jgi:alanine racemase
MSLTLHVDEPAWRSHVRAVAAAHPGVVPVIKGNGYGFGRARLAAEALALGATEVAVGTVHELAGLPPGPIVQVLTPAAPGDTALAGAAVLTVGSLAHVRALAGWRGRALVKLRSPMQRFGARPDELPALLAALAAAGLELHGFGLHFPLAGDPAVWATAAEAWDDHLPPGVPLYVSHAGPVAMDRPVRERIGTGLWHGDKAFLALRADVIDVQPVGGDDRVGYRLTPVPAAGHVVVVAAGTAHGVQPLADGRSPFHFARRRLALIEPPHMHVAMAFVPTGDPCPAIGDEVDVQRPLTQVWPDRVVTHGP